VTFIPTLLRKKIMTEATEKARALIARLAENWDWPLPALIEEIVAIGGEVVPAIAERLTQEFFLDARTEDRENSLLFYFTHLLGDSGNPAAIPILFNLYGELDDDDDLTEDIPDALQKLGLEALGPLLRLAADESLSWFPRASTSKAAQCLAGCDRSLQAQVLAVQREILSGYLSQSEPPNDDERDIIASITDHLALMADPEARPLIEAAFDAGLVGSLPKGNSMADIPIIDRAEVEELYAEGGRTEFRIPRPFLYYYPDRYKEEQKRLAKLERLKLLEENPALDTVVLSPRIGRNEPCWCGSGSKYKKCHLAQDEKEKSRLCLL